MTSLPNRFYRWIRHPSAHSLAGAEQTTRGFEHLRRHKYCLLVTYKRSGYPGPVLAQKYSAAFKQLFKGFRAHAAEPSAQALV